MSVRVTEAIIQKEIAENSIIHSDEWSAYSNLNRLNYHHLTVNHQRHYVDSNIWISTEATERSWLDLKIPILKKIRGVKKQKKKPSNRSLIISAGERREKNLTIYFLFFFNGCSFDSLIKSVRFFKICSILIFIYL